MTREEAQRIARNAAPKNVTKERVAEVGYQQTLNEAYVEAYVAQFPDDEYNDRYDEALMDLPIDPPIRKSGH